MDRAVIQMFRGPKNKFRYHQLLMGLAYPNLRLVTTPANTNANRVIAEIIFKAMADSELMAFQATKMRIVSLASLGVIKSLPL
jgi:hypothetical protein